MRRAVRDACCRLVLLQILLVASVASAQQPSTATNDPVADSPTSSLETVEVLARRQALSKAVDTFVTNVMRADGTDIASWRVPICSWVGGASPEQATFLRNRIGEIARSVGAPVNEDANCRSNLLVFLTEDPDELVRLLRSRNARMFSGGTPAGLDEFVRTPRPVRVWRNSTLVNADGTAPVQNSNKAAEYRLRDSHIVNSVAEGFAAMIVIVDTSRTGAATFGQLASYIAMTVLAHVDLDAELGSAPTILRLFSEADRALVANQLTDWDNAFLQTVYQRTDVYLEGARSIALRMTTAIEQQQK